MPNERDPYFRDLLHPAGWIQGGIIAFFIGLVAHFAHPELFKRGWWLYALIAVGVVAAWFLARAFNIDLLLRYRVWIPRVYKLISPLLKRLRLVRSQYDFYLGLIADSYQDVLGNGETYPTFIRRRDLRRFWWPHRVFQILLLNNAEQWVIKCHDGRWKLEVDITESNFGVYNNRGKKYLDNKYVEHLKQHQKSLQELLVHSRAIHEHLMGEPTGEEKTGAEFLGDMSLPLRWASGGVLPIVQYCNRNWVQLFFRDIKPIGWNIANGASESEAEYRSQLGRLMTREFCEESLLVSGGQAGGHYLYHRFEPEDAASRDYWSRTFWQRQVERRQEDDQVTIDESDDKVFVSRMDAGGMAVQVLDRRLGLSSPSRLNNVIFTINPCELGVEIITLRKFNCGKDEWILDGELHEEGYLLRRPAILIDLEYLRKQYEQNPRFGSFVENDMQRLECKVLNNIPSGTFKVFTQDVQLRHARRTRIANLLISERSPNVRRALKSELGYINEWCKSYERRFLEAATDNAMITDGHLRSLCPVTWKTLELAFRHGGL